MIRPSRFNTGHTRVRRIRELRDIESVNAAQAEMVKRSTWMINIGTHRKPFDETEYQLYRDSLFEAINDILDQDDVAEDLFYTVQPIPGRPREFRELLDPSMRTPEILQIEDWDTEVAVERGRVLGRIDAHILVSVIHRSNLRVDIRNFKQLLQDSLMEQNLLFQTNPGIYTGRDPGKPRYILEWPKEGVPYVTFNLIARFDQGAAHAYMSKQIGTGPYSATEQENEILSRTAPVLFDTLNLGLNRVR